MIFGECAYPDCDEVMITGMPEIGGQFARRECEKCKRISWVYCSRIDPWAITEEEFNKKYELNEETNVVKLKELVGDGREMIWQTKEK